jgi:predicted transcriptional regulator YheO
MSLQEDDRIFEILARLTTILGDLLGKTSEVVLHDFRKMDRSIVAISKVSLTDRRVGDTIDALGAHLFEQHGYRDMANYETRTNTGKVLRSCSVFIKDQAGHPLGALCVNQDRSTLLKMRAWIDQALETAEPEKEELNENNVEDVLSQLIRDAVRSTDKTLDELTREDKVSVIHYLDARGAFLIRYSMEKVASLLGISRYSIYNHLSNKRGDLVSASPEK